MVSWGDTAVAMGAQTGTRIRSTPEGLIVRILLADDEVEILRLYGDMLQGNGHEVVTAENGREVLDEVAGGDYDLLVLDLVLEDFDNLIVLPVRVAVAAVDLQLLDVLYLLGLFQGQLLLHPGQELWRELGRDVGLGLLEDLRIHCELRLLLCL